MISTTILSLMQPEVLSRIVEQAPSVAAIICVVIIFLRYLESEGKKNREFMTQMQQEHIDSRNESRKTILDNSTCLRDNIIATQRNSDMLAQLARIIELWDRKTHH